MTPSSIAAMLKLSSQKWEKFHITGDAVFKHNVILESVKLGFEDRITNPDMQQAINVEKERALRATRESLASNLEDLFARLNHLMEEDMAISNDPKLREEQYQAALAQIDEILRVKPGVDAGKMHQNAVDRAEDLFSPGTRVLRLALERLDMEFTSRLEAILVGRVESEGSPESAFRQALQRELNADEDRNGTPTRESIRLLEVRKCSMAALQRGSDRQAAEAITKLSPAAVFSHEQFLAQVAKLPQGSDPADIPLLNLMHGRDVLREAKDYREDVELASRQGERVRQRMMPGSTK